jgi:hypothetical protein
LQINPQKAALSPFPSLLKTHTTTKKKNKEGKGRGKGLLFGGLFAK